jgi:hypothetical protein
VRDPADERRLLADVHESITGRPPAIILGPDPNPPAPRCCNRSHYRTSRDGLTERCRSCGDRRPVTPIVVPERSPRPRPRTSGVLLAALLATMPPPRGTTAGDDES